MILLASTSPTRKALLESAGVPFRAAAPGVDEDALKAGLLAEGLGPREVADALAEAKAVKLSVREPAALVVGSDQTLDLDGALLSKPHSVAHARAQLMALRGRTHRLHAAVVAARSGQPVWRHVETVSLTVRAFSEAWLDTYLHTEGEAATASVGAYRIEGRGVGLFDRVEGDWHAVLGLPLIPLMAWLRAAGELAA